MKKSVLFIAGTILLAACPVRAENATVRDSSGRTIGTEEVRKNSDGSVSTTYRNASGQTTGTAVERRNADGSSTVTYRDSSGRTTGSKTVRPRR